MSPRHYDGRTEGVAAVLGICTWFVAIMVRLSLTGSGDWTWPEKLMEASSFAIFAALPIFGLATPTGERFAKQVLLPRQGLGFQALVCGLIGVLVGIGRSLQVNPLHFPWVTQMSDLGAPNQFYFNLALFLGGLFVALRIPFLLLPLRQKPLQQEPLQQGRPWQRGKSLRQQIKSHGELFFLLLLNLLYLCGVHTSLWWPQPPGSEWEGLMIGLVYLALCLGMSGAIGMPQRKASRRGSHQPYLDLSLDKPHIADHLTSFDLGLMVLCAASIYWVSTPSFSFGVFIAVDLLILVVVYGSGLGRAHFGYSFQMRRVDWLALIQILAIALVTLVPLAVFSGFVQPQRAEMSIAKILTYFALFTLRVGVFEEVFFRSGLMVFFRDQLLSRGGASPQQITWISALGCSLLFGIVHIGNEASDSGLSPWLYKSLYILLATAASMFYAIAFARSNRLAPAVLAHGFIDTVAVVLLGGFLSVPF